jgi:hypothetical protein
MADDTSAAMVSRDVRRFAASAVICVLAVGAGARAQQRPGDQAPAPGAGAAEKCAAAAEKWLASDQTSRDELDATVKVLLADPATGIAWLAAELKPALAAPNEPRSKSVQSLCTHTILDFCRRQRETNITFDGQYSALMPLQPYAGDLMFSLLLETPDWFPHNHRNQLIRPLRDLQPKAPPSSRLDAAIRLVEDEAVEPEGLRRAVAALLWQWGTKRHAQAFVDKLVVASGEGDAEDRVQASLELADYLCLLREYKQSASAHRAAQALAKGADVTLKPIAWYAAACVHALLGDAERGIVALDTCADLLASPHLDSSLRLPRTMFDEDPELALLRRDARFALILQKAFSVPAERPADRPAERSGR